MNKIEQLHLDVIEKNCWMETEFQGLHTYENEKSFTEINAEIVASKSAEITEQIAIEFYEWAEISKESLNFWRKHKVACYPRMDGSHIAIIKELRKELFQEFLKTKNHE